MYRHCIYCSADLKANAAIEGFPVGRTIAFDPARGRLWAVCARCGRWNLAPIEDRWEAVEDAERHFRDARSRVQRENVGLTRLSGGERLVRIGEAQGTELATWRYGDEIARRGRRASVIGAGVVGVVSLGFAGLAGFAVTSAALGAVLAWRAARGGYTVLPRSATDAPLRMRHLGGMRSDVDADGTLVLEVANEVDAAGGRTPILLRGDDARGLLQRAIARANLDGADRGEVAVAVEAVAAAGSAEAYLAATLRGGPTLHLAGGVIDWEAEIGAPWARGWYESARRFVMPDLKRFEPVVPAERGRGLNPVQQLGLEIALSEAQERRALEGELAVLQAAWREAEEIAGIADRLAISPGEG